MALMHLNMFSDSLGLAVSIDVIYPEAARAQIGMAGSASNEPPQVLYLLHGLSDDHTIWQRRTSIERYVAGLNLCVVMPTVARGFYTDQHNGYNYFSYVAHELPEKLHKMLKLSDKREDTFAAGLSMGGYGAMKLGLTLPAKYAAVASLSGVLDIASISAGEQNGPFKHEEFENTFGDIAEICGSKHDLLHLATELKASGAEIPKLYVTCGTEDFIYGLSRNFTAHLDTLGVDYTYDESPGVHEWGFWDRTIQDVLKWLPLKSYADADNR